MRNISIRNITIIILTAVLTLLVALDVYAGEHRHYLGVHLVHLSNLDAGAPFNDTRYEDSTDHGGIMYEYNYVLRSGNVFYGGIGVGKTQMNLAEGGHRWECGGCDYNSSIVLGFKWRID